MAYAGILIFFFNPQTAFFFFLILIPAILLRILVEEKTLVTINGYKEYADHKKRLIPFVWWWGKSRQSFASAVPFSNPGICSSS
jgi:protein-S-isoprenylcysteine O-methyltransferase Ste14